MTDHHGTTLRPGDKVVMLTDDPDETGDGRGGAATFTVLEVLPAGRYLVQLGGLDPATVALVDQANAWFAERGEPPYDLRDPVEVPGTQLLYTP